jgi:hypothetical protein
MEHSPHVMLIGSGADAFAASVHLEQVPPSFFFTERSWQALIRELQKQGLPIPARPEGAPAPASATGGPSTGGPYSPSSRANVGTEDAHHYGTVGVVALDRVTSLPEPPPAASPPSAGTASATRPSLARELTPPTTPAPFPPPESANTSSASPLPAPSAPSSNTKA